VSQGWGDLDRGLFSISVASELAGLHPQTLRIYEREGRLESPAASCDSDGSCLSRAPVRALGWILLRVVLRGPGKRVKLPPRPGIGRLNGRRWNACSWCARRAGGR
jgi:hypothetical protein